jgi:hypothetical protein
MAKAAPAGSGRITRDDLERHFAAVQDEIQGKVRDRKRTIIGAVSVTAILVLLIVFLLGKRSGKRKTTLVEIRRV